MDLFFEIIVAVVLFGGALYLLSMAPINEAVKKIGTVVLVIIAILWAIRLLRGMF